MTDRAQPPASQSAPSVAYRTLWDALTRAYPSLLERDVGAVEPELARVLAVPPEAEEGVV